jgi:membrane-associated phospholipid phosphatase
MSSVRLCLLIAPTLLGHVCAGSSLCPLPWNYDTSWDKHVNKNAECPHGRLIDAFDVTVPNGADVWDYVCVAYGILPFVIVALVVLELLVSSIILRGVGTRQISFLAFIGFITLVNEFIFKKIAQEPRPDLSCNFSCGFPSGHSTMSVGFFFLLFLDGSYRVMTQAPLDAKAATRLVSWMSGKRTFLNMSLRDWLIAPLRTLSLVPLCSSESLDAYNFTVLVTFQALLLLPVPMSRVYLHDHTPKQVIVGGAAGAVEAIIWFNVWRRLCTLWCRRLGQRIGFVFIHNYPLPYFEIGSRVYILAAQLEEDNSKEEGVREKIAEQLEGYYSALGWYSKYGRPNWWQKCLMFDEEQQTWKMVKDSVSKWQAHIRMTLDGSEQDVEVQM